MISHSLHFVAHGIQGFEVAAHEESMADVSLSAEEGAQE